MKWFKHDSDAFCDARVKKLILKYGVVGYGIYFHCLELIASNVTDKNMNFELEHDAEIIADDLKINGSSDKSGREVVEDVMRYIIQLGLFTEISGHIYCTKMLERMDSSMTSNPKMRSLIAKAKENHDTVMIESGQSHDTIMLDKIRLDKIRIDNNINSADKSATNNKTVYDSFLTIQDNLYKDLKINDKLDVNYSVCSKLISNILKNYSYDDILRVLRVSQYDKFILSCNYDLQVILSNKVFSRLVELEEKEKSINSAPKKETEVCKICGAPLNLDGLCPNCDIDKIIEKMKGGAE